MTTLALNPIHKRLCFQGSWRKQQSGASCTNTEARTAGENVQTHQCKCDAAMARSAWHTFCNKSNQKLYHELNWGGAQITNDLITFLFMLLTRVVWLQSAFVRILQ